MTASHFAMLNLYHFRLDSLEVSANSFFPPSEARTLRDRLSPVSSLTELCAGTVVRLGLKVGPEDVSPQLLHYLDSVMRCLCGKPVWNNVVTALVNMDLSRVANQISAGGLSTVCIEAQLCSTKCLNIFKNNPYAF